VAHNVLRIAAPTCPREPLWPLSWPSPPPTSHLTQTAAK
jgi:hypothetical protein